MPLPDFTSAYALCASADCTRRSSQSERRRVAGADAMRSRSRARTPRASDVKQRCRTASLRAKRSNPVQRRGSGLLRRSAPRNDEQIIKGSGTPADAHCNARTQQRTGRATEKAACAALPLSGALACRRSTAALAAATERHRSAPVHALPGTELLRSGCYPPPAVPVQRAL